MGNGAKAQQKRDRNAKAAGTGSKSSLKTNEAAKSVVCDVCKQTFLVTVRQPQLEEHAQNKHSKGIADCFPNYGK